MKEWIEVFGQVKMSGMYGWEKDQRTEKELQDTHGV